jgi:hypothetical protein
VTIANGTLGNVISGNSINGIEVNDTPTVTIQGNRIGTNGAGTAALGNANSGIATRDGSTLAIGGTGSGESNLISGNGGAGIETSLTVGLTVYGNMIGLNLAGANAIGNILVGIVLSERNGALIGPILSGTSSQAMARQASSRSPLPG